MSISSTIDLLITNMLTFSQSFASFPANTAEMPKLCHGVAGRAQQTKRFQAGQSLHVVRQARLQADGRGCFDNLFSG